MAGAAPLETSGFSAEMLQRAREQASRDTQD
jgi:hypothetical protein